MKRGIRAALVFSSLLLLLATMGLWIRSYWKLDKVWFCDDRGARGPDWSLSVKSIAGVLRVERRLEPPMLPRTNAPPRRVGCSCFSCTAYPMMRPKSWEGGYIGLGFGHGETFGFTVKPLGWWFSVPHGVPAACFAAGPEWAGLVARRRKRRAQRNLCPNCGYDIRATPEADGPLLERCPECGKTSAA